MRSTKSNPRSSAFRRKYRLRLKAMDAPCGICKGRLGRIHYEEPSDSDHPLSFVIDEIIPVSKWRQFGYPSREAVALDINNLQAAHYCCNASKGAKLKPEKVVRKSFKKPVLDGEW